MEIRAAEQGPQLILQLHEARVRDDGLLVDQVALDRGEHLLVRHVGRLHHREAGEAHAAGGDQGLEALQVHRLRGEALAHLVGEGRERAQGLHVHEATLELDLEVAIQPGLGLRHGQDQRVVHRELDAVQALEDQRVGVQQPEVLQRVHLEIEPPVEDAVRAHDVVVEGARAVDAAERERDQGAHVGLLPEHSWEHRAHQPVHQLPVLVQHGDVVDGPEERGHLVHARHERPRHLPAHGRVLGLLVPEADQRGEAEAALEGEIPREVRGELGDAFVRHAHHSTPVR